VWDWRKAREAFPPLVHQSELLAARFCPDDRWIVTCSAATSDAGAGGALRFWERRTGRPATPPEDGIGSQIVFPASGEFAAVGCETGSLYIVDLDEFNTNGFPDLPPGDLHLLAEVLSGEQIDEAGKLVELSAREWITHWRELREAYPELLSLGWSERDIRRWHRRRAKICHMKEEWAACEWHLQRLAALGARTESDRHALRAYVRNWSFARTTRPWPNAREFPDLDASLRDSIEEEALASELVSSHSPRIDFGRRFPEHAVWVAGYAARTIFSDEGRKIRLLIGSDDEVRVWLNGDLVVKNLVRRSAVADQDAVEMELHDGLNRLLVEVGNAVGLWALYVRIEDQSGRTLWLTDAGRLEPLEGYPGE
jgi:hypothetical protein